MRAGNLDRVIIIERETKTLDLFGTVVDTWVPVATMRAQLLQNSTQEFLRGEGASTEATFVFRTRWLDGVTTAYRVTYLGQPYIIKEISEIGRRRGLDLRCWKSGA